jgi:hypothetical protein
MPRGAAVARAHGGRLAVARPVGASRPAVGRECSCRPHPQRWCKSMSRRRLALAAAVAVLGGVVIVGAILARDTGPAPAVPSSGASDSLRVDGTNIVTGKEISLEQFDGKPVGTHHLGFVVSRLQCRGTHARPLREGSPRGRFLRRRLPRHQGRSPLVLPAVRLALPERLRPGRPDRV